MANPNVPKGLVPVRTLHGTPWNEQLMKCFIPSTDNNDMFIGDPVDLAGSADPKGVCPTVVRVAGGAGNPILGAIVAFEHDPDNPTLLYRKAGTARYCYVCVDPFTVYEIQAEGSNVLSKDVVGLNAVLYAGAGGSTTTGLSSYQLDAGVNTAPSVNATYQLLILRAVPREDNDITKVNAKWEVLISLSRLNPNYSGGAYFGIRGVA